LKQRSLSTEEKHAECGPSILFCSRNESQTGFLLSKSRLNRARTALKLGDPFRRAKRFDI